jgi:hypothetical protein
MTILFTIINLRLNKKKQSNDFINEKEEFYLNDGREEFHSMEVSFSSFITISLLIFFFSYRTILSV